MKRFCVNCGSEVDGNFCGNCGAKIDNSNVGNSQVGVNNPQVFTNSSTVNKKNYNTYRTVVGIILILLGVCLLIFSFNDDQTYVYRLAGYNIVLTFMIPGICSLVGGILSILSKNKNLFLLVSGILYFCGAIVNMCSISDISPLFIVSCVFCILNIVFFVKTR